ncbi:MAG: choice-of-anchor A family protein, partial [Desulfuromonadaceae bacterium]
KWGSNMILTGDGASKVQVFQLDGADLLNSSVLLLNNVAADATLLLNVSGQSTGLTSMGLGALQAYGDRVLFNFFEADLLQLAGVGIWGSILAPFADIAQSQGIIHGTLIASSFAGTMQQNYNPFQGELGTPVPEPSTLLLFLIGAWGVYRVSRRRDEKRND